MTFSGKNFFAGEKLFWRRKIFLEDFFKVRPEERACIYTRGNFIRPLKNNICFLMTKELDKTQSLCYNSLVTKNKDKKEDESY